VIKRVAGIPLPGAVAALMLFPQSVPPAAIEASKLKIRAVPPPVARRIELFMDAEDAYSGAVLSALPEFARIGRWIFGDKLPSVRLFLMANGEHYRAFTRATFGQERVTGTGSVHIVTICLACENRPQGETETTAVVLHEFGHAWLNTYLKDGWGLNYLSGEIRRPYLDEGLADFIADQWDHEFLSRRARWTRDLKAARGVPPPKFDELKNYDSFYDHGDRELHYWISALLIQRMIGTEAGAATKILRYLDLIGAGESPDRAWERATRKSLTVEYSALIQDLWKGQ